MKSVYIKLTAVGGNIAAQFNIKSNSDGCTAVLEVVDTVDLQAGYTCTVIPDDATEICLEEIAGPCEANITLTIVECTTTTTTEEPTTTTSSTTEEPTTTTSTTEEPTTTTSTTEEPTTTTTTTIYPCYDCYSYDLYCDLGEGQSALFLCLTCAGEVLYQSVPSESSPMTECCWSVPILMSAPGAGHVEGGVENCGEYCPTTTTTTLPPDFYYYSAERWSCVECSLLIGEIEIAANNSVDLLHYYAGEDGYVYYLNSSTGSNSNYVGTLTDQSDTCEEVVCVTTTTTTTLPI